MASPRFDSLVQRISLPLNDYVASASSDGNVYKKVDRAYLINEAQKILWDFLYSGWAKVRQNEGNLASSRFDDLINFSTFSTASDSTYTLSGLSLAGSVVELLALTRTADLKKVKIYQKADVPQTLQNTIDAQQSKTNPIAYLDVALQKIIVLPNATENQTKAFSAAILRYPKVDFVQGDTSDIEWNTSFDSGLLNLAYARALLDDNRPQDYLAILQMQMQLYGYNQNLLNDTILKRNLK